MFTPTTEDLSTMDFTSQIRHLPDHPVACLGNQSQGHGKRIADSETNLNQLTYPRVPSAGTWGCSPSTGDFAGPSTAKSWAM